MQKILGVFVYKVTDIFNTNTWLPLARQQNIKKWWFLKKSQIILQS